MKLEAQKNWEGDLQIRATIPGMEGFSIATVHPERVQTAGGYIVTRDDWETARLLASAPELLAALRDCLPIVDAMRRKTGGEGDTAAMNARAAIAKAERGGHEWLV
jgi:hypothetical protein